LYRVPAASRHDGFRRRWNIRRARRLWTSCRQQQEGFPGIPAGARWYCFDPEDSGSLDAPDAIEWVPQGVTTAADSGAGPDALLVSWYDSRTAPAKGVRVSFLDPATNKYRHVLLVYPTADGSYEIVGRPAGGIHADGLVHAAEVQRLPVHNVQGAVSAGDSYYLSRSRGSSTNGQLIPATPSADPAGTLRPGDARAAGIGPEDLSY
jgi:hypothetical protein